MWEAEKLCHIVACHSPILIQTMRYIMLHKYRFTVTIACVHVQRFTVRLSLIHVNCGHFGQLIGPKGLMSHKSCLISFGLLVVSLL